jgi:hypothetical protein
MTLISAFKCSGGFVLCADSEENYGTFRRAVQKIVPSKMGHLDVIVAGSGIGELIDGFTDRLKERLDADKATDIADVKRLIENRLPNFFATEVSNYPAADEDKLHKFIVAAYSPSSREFDVWRSHGTRLMSVTSYELAGVEDALYDYNARRLHTPDMTFPQAILASLYLFSIAESTCTHIRNPFQVAAIWEDGIMMEKPEYVKAICERLGAYEDAVNALFLAAADTTIQVHVLKKKIEEFPESITALHRQHIDETVASLTVEEVVRSDGPHLKRPFGVVTMYTDGLRVEHDEKVIEAKNAEFRKMIALAAEKADRLKRATDWRDTHPVKPLTPEPEQ